MEETLLWKWEGNRNNHCPCFRLEPASGMLSRGGRLVMVVFTAGKRIGFPCENRDRAQGPMPYVMASRWGAPGLQTFLGGGGRGRAYS